MLAPWFLWLTLLIPLAAWIRRRRGAPAIRFAPAGFLENGLPRTWRTRLAGVPAVMQAAGVGLAIVALARPVRIEPRPQTTAGIDVLLCLDVSSSMAEDDLDPGRTRLDVAKSAAKKFIARRPDDRIGLIAFARYPDLRSPLTQDHRALGTIIDGIEMVRRDGPEDATGIGTAVARAAQVLGAGTAVSKVVILLTDGDENVATMQTSSEIAPLHAGQLCKDTGVRVHVVAVGVGRRSESGEWQPLDTGQAGRMAQKTGGGLFEARDAAAVEGVYADIDALEVAELERTTYEVHESFVPFLLAALTLLLAGRFLASTVFEVLP